MADVRVISADEARAILNDLIRQRQRMRFDEPDAGLLEANRLGIVYWQMQLARALSAEARARTSAA